jgi:hypothetical protein
MTNATVAAPAGKRPSRLKVGSTVDLVWSHNPQRAEVVRVADLGGSIGRVYTLQLLLPEGDVSEPALIHVKERDFGRLGVVESA